jgi:hypothetical protein
MSSLGTNVSGIADDQRPFIHSSREKVIVAMIVAPQLLHRSWKCPPRLVRNHTEIFLGKATPFYDDRETETEAKTERGQEEKTREC